MLEKLHVGNFFASKKSGDSSAWSRSGSSVAIRVASSTALTRIGIADPGPSTTEPLKIATVPVTRSTQMCCTLNCALDRMGSIARGPRGRGRKRGDENEAHERGFHEPQYATLNWAFIVFMVCGTCPMTSSIVMRVFSVGPYPIEDYPVAREAAGRIVRPLVARLGKEPPIERIPQLLKAAARRAANETRCSAI